MGADPAARPAPNLGPLIEGSATMPTRPRKQDEEPSVVDEMAEEATTPPEYPAGAPEFKALLTVRRGRRAEFKRLVAQVAEKGPRLRAEQETMKDLPDGEREAAGFRLWADLDELNEVVEQALRLVAVDPEAFDAWAAEVSDEDLQATWAAYQSRTQPGEASSSAS